MAQITITVPDSRVVGEIPSIELSLVNSFMQQFILLP